MEYNFDKEHFCTEVSLLAMNNYGNWKSEYDVENFILNAIEDTLTNKRAEIRNAYLSSQEYKELKQRMIEANEVSQEDLEASAEMLDAIK